MRLLCLTALSLVAAATAQAATGTELPNSTLYPRLIRIAHGSPSANGHLLASTTGRVFESSDEGKTFHLLSQPVPQPGSKERCCATLFELPIDVGALKAGTLLYSASTYTGSVPSIEVYSSTDGGRTWVFHSVVKRAGDEKHGLWEPQFAVTQTGALAVFWSDETDPCCSQKLAQARSTDGRTWTAEQDTVRTAVSSDRPGMVTLAQLPSGTWFMTYEVCGHFNCGVFVRTSRDGWNYGDPASLGDLIRTAAGEYFAHAPQVAWIPTDGGSLLVVGQMLYRSDGTVDPQQNGRVLFRNIAPENHGTWTVMSAPIDVPRAFDNYCPNYSSALMSTDAGSSLLELASDYDAAHRCTTYYATGAIHALEQRQPQQP